MLNTIVKMANKPTIDNYQTLCSIMYDLTSLDVYAYGISLYYQSNAMCGYTSFFNTFWNLRKEVMATISK